MKRDTAVNIRLTSAERDELQRRADAAKRTLSDYIRLILQAHLEEEQSAERRKR
jgi:Mobilization protein NikA